MEKRAFLAVILMFLVLLLYEMLSRPVRQVPLEGPAPDSMSTIIHESASVEEEPVRRVDIEVDSGVPSEVGATAIAEKSIEVETDLVRAILSNRGPSILSWQLKKFPGLDSECRTVARAVFLWELGVGRRRKQVE
jgi:YidC/Oxa1 family membrane protein insertase